MHLISSTKLPIQKLRDDGCDELVAIVKSFCKAIYISVPNFNAPYVAKQGRARHQQDDITVKQYYKIDSQLQELNDKFNDNTVELLILSSFLDTREMHVSFRIGDIYKLVKKNYPQDFAEEEMI